MTSHLRNILLFLSISFLLHPSLWARSVMSYGDIEVVGGFEIMQPGQSSGPVVMDGMIGNVAYAAKTVDEYTLDTDLLEEFSYIPPAPQFLSWTHGRYFVHPPEDGPVQFSVRYADPYSSVPDPGYPKVVYWKQGSHDYQERVLSGDGALYSFNQDVSTGTYWYRYIVKSASTISEYTVETSSFVVSRRPAPVMKAGLADNQMVPNGKVRLTWTAGAESVRFKVYLGADPDALTLAYEGDSPSCDIPGLKPGQTYYWQVESFNEYGLSSKGPVYRFVTLASIDKPFNYPNPFNPAKGEKTHIVFMMNASGSAELTIFSEYGDRIWQEQHDGLLTGSHEVIFDGRDGSGNVLYNGSYVCVIIKKYADGEKRERCRLLVIK